jgi:phospholipase/carboxylesterase
MSANVRENLECVVVEPQGPHRASVIWLHGLGADGHDFEPIVPHLELPRELGVRFVFPNAPRIPVSINMGMVMPAWYDIRDLDPNSRHDPDGIERTRRSVERLIDEEQRRGVPAERIVLAGFSQGGAIALHVALRRPEKLAGIVALSCYLVHADTLESEASAANRDIPILWVHGSEDPMVTYDRGVTSVRKLEALGWKVDFKTYPMQHEVCAEELEDVANFLRATLA